MSDRILTETSGGVRVVSLNRPDRHNAFDRALYDGCLAAMRQAVVDRDVRAIVLRGEGRSFSSGIDTSSLGQRGPEETHWSHGRHTQELNLLMADAPKPVIAALKGHVLGKGLETALAADMRVIARGTQLGFPEVKFGLSTDNGGAPRSVALAGPSRSKYLIMSGDLIDAEVALAWGLADWLVEPDDLDAFTLDLAGRLAARAPLALAVAKEMVDQVHRAAIVNGTRSEMIAQIALMSTEDHVEAKAASREKRTPSLRGR